MLHAIEKLMRSKCLYHFPLVLYSYSLILSTLPSCLLRWVVPTASHRCQMLGAKYLFQTFW